MRAVRGGAIGLIFQEPMTALSVHYTVGNQIIEAMRAHSDCRRRRRASASWRCCTRSAFRARNGGSTPIRSSSRAACASASVLRWRWPADPQILIADEPTTALDVTTQAQILALLRRLQRTKGVALMLITHDMGVIARDGRRRRGDVSRPHGRVRAGRRNLFAAPQHPYTRALLRSVPEYHARRRANGWRPSAARSRIPVRARSAARFIRAVRRSSRDAAKRWRRRKIPPGERGASCFHAAARRRHRMRRRPHERARTMCSRSKPLQGIPDPERAAAARDRPGARGPGCQLLRSAAARRWRWSARAAAARPPCRAASCARCRRPRARSASRTRRGSSIDMAPLSRRALRPLRRHMQMIFQDPFASLNPRMMVGDIIAEPLLVNGMPAAQRRRRGCASCSTWCSCRQHTHRFPHAFSGGQRQRIGIARALALEPAADRGRRAGLRARRLGAGADHQPAARPAGPAGPVYLFVAHDLAVVHHVSDRVAVMYVGAHRRDRADHGALSRRRGIPTPRRCWRRCRKPIRRCATRRIAPQGRGRRSRQSAARLRLPSALPLRGGALPRRTAGLERNRTRALERVSSRRGAVAPRRCLEQ